MFLFSCVFVANNTPSLICLFEPWRRQPGAGLPSPRQAGLRISVGLQTPDQSQKQSGTLLRCLNSNFGSRQRQRQRFWVHCWLRAIPSVLQVFVEIVFRELMSEWNDVVSRRQRRYERKSQGWKAQSGLRAPEWQCAACKTRSFLSRDTCRGCSKQRDTKQDEYINEWSQTVAWPQQGGYPLEIPLGRRHTLATLGQARAAAMPEACLRILEPVPQVNVSLVRTLEALTGIIENLWNPDAGQPPEH